MAIKKPENEPERLSALRSLQIYKSDRTPEFDAVVQAVADIFDAPIALVSLVEEDEQWFKAKCGIDADTTSREVSFCSHAILSGDVFVVPDATKDIRFRSNSLVTGAPFIRFYAGCPLSLDGVLRLGSLCVIDTKTHEPPPAQLKQLRRLGTVVEGLIRAHRDRANERHAKAEAAREHKEALDKSLLLREVAKVAQVGGWSYNNITHQLNWDARMRAIHEVPDDYVPTLDSSLEFLPNEAQLKFDALIARARAEGTGWEAELPLVTAKGNARWVHVAGAPVYEDGKRVRVVGATKDITERKQREEALQKAEARQRTILTTLAEGVLLVSHDGEIQSYNPAAQKILGLQDTDLTGVMLQDLTLKYFDFDAKVFGSNDPLALAAIRPELVEGETFRIKLPGRKQSRWIQLNAEAVDERNESGLAGSVLLLADITKEKLNDEALQVLFNNLPAGLGHWDENHILVGYNDTFLEILDITKEQARNGLHLYDHLLENAIKGIYGPGDPNELAELQFQRVVADEPSFFERPRPDGTVHEVRSTPLPGGGVIVSFFDITERKRLERELIENEALALMRSVELESILDNMKQGVSVFGGDGKLRLWNNMYLEIFNKPLSEIKKGSHFVDILSAEKDRGEFEGDPEEHYLRLLGRMARSEVVQSTFHHPDGRVINSEHVPMPDGGWIGTHEDVTLQHMAQEKISYAASHDALTGLANRAFFMAELDKAIITAREGGPQSTLMLIDLDRFKPINDTYGHDAGDELLKTISARMKDVIRGSDLVARLGGDEFAVILYHIGANRERICEIAETLIASIGQPVSYGSQSLSVGLSIGIVDVTSEANEARDVIKQADMALYEVKGSGRNNYCFYADLFGGTSAPRAKAAAP